MLQTYVPNAIGLAQNLLTCSVWRPSIKLEIVITMVYSLVWTTLEMYINGNFTKLQLLVESCSSSLLLIAVYMYRPSLNVPLPSCHMSADFPPKAIAYFSWLNKQFMELPPSQTCEVQQSHSWSSWDWLGANCLCYSVRKIDNDMNSMNCVGFISQ